MFYDRKLTKSNKKNIFWYKIAIYLSLCIPKRRPIYREAFSPQKRTSSTSKHEISYFFIFLWVIFALLDPDPDSESGSTDLTKSGSATLPSTNSVHHERFVWYIIVISVTVFMKYRFKKLIPNDLSGTLVCFLAFLWQVLCPVMGIHPVTGSRLFAWISNSLQITKILTTLGNITDFVDRQGFDADPDPYLHPTSLMMLIRIRQLRSGATTL